VFTCSGTLFLQHSGDLQEPFSMKIRFLRGLNGSECG
jgi:hypothetical protein